MEEIVCTIVDWAAIVIALCALGITIWQGIETRTNNRLSVTPSICLENSWVPNDEVVGIQIANKGIGPAKITNLIIKPNTTTTFGINQQLLFMQYLNKDLKDKKGGIEYQYQFIDKFQMISAGETFQFIWLNESDKGDLEVITNFYDVIKEFKIEIEYQSIYNEQFYCIESLDFQNTIIVEN